MKTTNSDKRNLFTRYYGQKVMRNGNFFENIPNSIVNVGNAEYDNYYLSLKTFNDLTEEDVKELNRLFFKMDDTLTKIDFQGILLTMFNMDILVGNDLLLRQFSPMDFVSIYQHLIDNGFAMDYYSLEQNRIIKIAEQIKLGWIKTNP